MPLPPISIDDPMLPVIAPQDMTPQDRAPLSRGVGSEPAVYHPQTLAGLAIGAQDNLDLHKAAAAPHSGHAVLAGSNVFSGLQSFANGFTTPGPAIVPAASADNQAVNRGQLTFVAGQLGTARIKDVSLASSASGVVTFTSTEIGAAVFLVAYVYGHRAAGSAAKRLYRYTALFDGGFNNLIGSIDLLSGSGSASAFTLNSVTMVAGELSFSITNNRGVSGTIYVQISEVR